MRDEVRILMLNYLIEVVKGKGIYIIVPKPSDYNEVDMILISYLTKKLQFPGIFVSLNTEYFKILEMMKMKGIDTSKLFFIDAVSKMTNKTIKNNDTTSFISSPGSLTELSLLLNNLINTGKFKFLFLDSLSTLLIYNDLKTAEQFSHYLVSRLRNSNTIGIITSIAKEDSREALLDFIVQLCDKHLYL